MDLDVQRDLKNKLRDDVQSAIRRSLSLVSRQPFVFDLAMSAVSAAAEAAATVLFISLREGVELQQCRRAVARIITEGYAEGASEERVRDELETLVREAGMKNVHFVRREELKVRP